MRKYSFLFTLLLLSASSFAQNKDFSYKFYGQVRTDLYYNSRVPTKKLWTDFSICIPKTKYMIQTEKT